VGTPANNRLNTPRSGLAWQALALRRPSNRRLLGGVVKRLSASFRRGEAARFLGRIGLCVP
jgi:hypothetical protein